MNIHLVELGEIWGNNGECRFYCWILVSCRRSYCCFDARERKFDWFIFCENNKLEANTGALDFFQAFNRKAFAKLFGETVHSISFKMSVVECEPSLIAPLEQHRSPT